MRFLLVRVDDRLLHGQVAYGWAARLAPRAFLIVDDHVAADPWEREAYQAIPPAASSVDVIDVAGFAQRWQDWPDAAGTIVLLRDLACLRRLHAQGFSPVGGVNLGGLHARGASREVLPFLHLTDGDVAILRELIAAGLDLCAQELPEGPRLSAEAILQRIPG